MKRARDAGVQKIFITGTNLEDSKEAIDFINLHDEGKKKDHQLLCLTQKKKKKAKGFLFSTVGCHPTRCGEFDQFKDGSDAYFNKLLELATNCSNSVIAIGECGLDYDRLHFCDKETQKKYFEKQFDLAEKTQLPMFLHNRNTGQDFYELVKANRHKFTHGVVHSFTGSLEEMKMLVDLDLYIGVNGCSLKTEENLEVVKAIPEDRLMIETDAPWCDIRPTHASFSHLKNISEDEMKVYSPPSKKKEKFELGCMVKSRNEPCTTGLVLHVVASIRGKDPAELSEIIWTNTCKVFNTAI